MMNGSTINLMGEIEGKMVIDGGTLAMDNEGDLALGMQGGTIDFVNGTVEFTGSQASIGLINGGTQLDRALGHSSGHMNLDAGQSILAADALAIYNTPFTVSGGTIRSGSLNVSGTTFNLTNGGRLETQFVIGTLLNESGVFAPGQSPAASVVLGDYTQTGGSLEIELGGVGVGEYDTLLVSGQFTPGGDLDVVWYDGFTAAASQQFDIFSWGTLAGTFDNVNLPELAEGLEWDTSSLYTTGSLAVVAIPEPSAALLLAGAGLGLLLRRRRDR